MQNNYLDKMIFTVNEPYWLAIPAPAAVKNLPILVLLLKTQYRCPDKLEMYSLNLADLLLFLTDISLNDLLCSNNLNKISHMREWLLKAKPQNFSNISIHCTGLLRGWNAKININQTLV